MSLPSAHKRDLFIWPCIAGLGALALCAQLTMAVRAAFRNSPVSSPRVAESYAPADVDSIDPRAWDAALSMATADLSEFLIDAIVQVESAGDPRCVGKAGERGLMQIKRGTWSDTTARTFGERVPFSRAFEPGLNVRVGRQYLAYLQGFLLQHRSEWRGDERALLLASYNAGPGRVQQSGFDLKRLPEATRDYVRRVCALHDLYVARGYGEPRDVAAAGHDETYPVPAGAVGS